MGKLLINFGHADSARDLTAEAQRRGVIYSLCRFQKATLIYYSEKKSLRLRGQISCGKGKHRIKSGNRLLILTRGRTKLFGKCRRKIINTIKPTTETNISNWKICCSY